MPSKNKTTKKKGSGESNSSVASRVGDDEVVGVDDHLSETKILEATLASLPALLQQRNRQLDEKEKQLAKAIKNFEKEKATYCNGNVPKPSDVLHLNVGGTKMCVLRRTLTDHAAPGSMLASRFSGRWDDNHE